MIAGHRAAAAGVVIAVLMSGCQGATKATPEASTQRAGGSEYPKETVRAFMASCTAQSNATKEGCLCLLGEYEAKYSYSAFMVFDAQMRAGTPSAELEAFTTAASNRCAANALGALPSCSSEGAACTVHGMPGKCLETYVVGADGRERPERRCNLSD